MYNNKNYMNKIYLDNNATTLIDKRVLDIIKDEKYPLNPSSMHSYGRIAKEKLFNARSTIANFLKTKDENLIFTSGGTESANSSIRGIAESNPKCHIISSNSDHSCIYNTLLYLQIKGFDVSLLPTGKKGFLDINKINDAIKPTTKIIVISAVNSETGVKTDIEPIAKIAKEKDIHLIVDGVALLGKESFTIPDGISAMFFSSHKIHGPKGVGLIYLKSSIKNYTPLLYGGPQEMSKRSGTENLQGILGFAKAIELLDEYMPASTKNMISLKDHFEKTLLSEIDISINGEGNKICNTSNICFKNIDAQDLLILLDQNGVLASLGSACTSGSVIISRVLLNMGYDPKDARSSIRFSLCRNTTKEEIDKALEIIIKAVKKLYNL